jgi:hypothetical protein
VAPALQAKLAKGLARNTTLTSLRLDWRLSTDDLQGKRSREWGTFGLQQALAALMNLRDLTLGSYELVQERCG